MAVPIITLHEIAHAIGAELPHNVDPAMRVSGATSLDQAVSGEVTFYDDPRYLRALRATKADVVLVPTAFSEEVAQVVLRVSNPSGAFESILEKFAPPSAQAAPGIHPTAVIADTAEIHPTACIHACAVIEAGVRIGAHTTIGAQVFVGRGSQLGEGCRIYSHASLGEGSILGARVVVHSSSVIGGEGFGFRTKEGAHRRLSHLGYVQLDDDVEVGACTTIDRGRFGRTWIQTGTKIDNLVQIAHNVVIGPHCLIISQTGISGSAKLGKYVILAGQVGVVGHVEIGDQVVVTAKGGVSKSVPAGQHVMGMFAIPLGEARELVAHYRRLPKTVAKIKKLEQELADLKALVADLTAKV